MKTILYVIPQLRRGGGEKQFILLLKYLDRTKYAPIIACLESTSEYQNELNSLGIIVHHLPGNKFVQILRLYMIMRKHKATIIHTWLNNEWGRIAAILYRLSTRKSISIIASERDEMNHSSRHFKRTFIQLNRILSFFTNYITFNSPKALSYFEDGLYKNGVSKFIGNGIESTEITAAPTPSISSTIQIAIVARLVIQKDHLFILRALASYPRRDRIQLNLIGDGPLRQELENFIRSNDISKQVQFCGKQNNIPELLKKHQIGALCSMSEGFSNAVLEYMANGLALLVTDAGANSKCIHNNGYLISSESEIHSAFDSYLDRPDLLQAHRIESIHFAKNFAIESIVSEFQLLYGDENALQHV